MNVINAVWFCDNNFSKLNTLFSVLSEKQSKNFCKSKTRSSKMMCNTISIQFLWMDDHNYIKKKVEKIHKINEKCIHTAVFPTLLAEKMIKLKLNYKMKVKHKERLIWNRLRIKVHWNNCEWHFVVRKHNQQHIAHIWLLWQFDSLTVVQYEHTVDCKAWYWHLKSGLLASERKSLSGKLHDLNELQWPPNSILSICGVCVNDDDERFHAI